MAIRTFSTSKAGIHFVSDTSLYPEPSGIINGSTLAISASGRVVTITSTDFKIKYYYQGTYGELPTPVSTTLDDVAEQVTFLYINSSGALTQILPSAFPDAHWYTTVPFLAYAYYDGAEVWLSHEWHGHLMSGPTHDYLHKTRKCVYQEDGGFALTIGNTTFSLTTGTIWDEDLATTITGPTTQARICYRSGTAWKRTALQTAPYATDGGNILYDNSGTVTQMDSSKYAVYWIHATNDVDMPIAIFMGQRQDSTLALARTNNVYTNFSWGTLPSAEMKLLYRVIFKNDASPYVEVADYRSSGVVASTSSTASPNSLSTDQIAGIQASNGMSASNPAATLADIGSAGTLTADQIQAITGANSPSASNVFQTAIDVGDTTHLVTPVNQAAATFTNIADAENKIFFRYKPIITSLTSIPDLSNIYDDITIQGDTRPLAGYTYVHCPLATTTIPHWTTVAGAGTGYVTLSSSGNTVTITMSGTAVDLTGWGNGDKLYICNTSRSVSLYTIDSISGSTITLTSAAPTVNAYGASITFVPNQTITQDITFTHTASRVTFQGYLINSNATAQTGFITYGNLRCSNCVFVSSRNDTFYGDRYSDTIWEGFENTIIGGAGAALVTDGGNQRGAITTVYGGYFGALFMGPGNITVDYSRYISSAGYNIHAESGAVVQARWGTALKGVRGFSCYCGAAIYARFSYCAYNTTGYYSGLSGTILCYDKTVHNNSTNYSGSIAY